MLTTRVLLIISLLCGLTTAQAQIKPAFEWVDGVKQHPDYRFKITTDKNPPFYHAGEKVTFTLSAMHKGQHIDGKEIQWEITNDGVMPALQSGKMILKNGQAVFSGSLNQPGFLQCSINFKSLGELVPGAKAAAAIDAQEIKPSMPPPDDFLAFWAEQKKKLAAVPMNIKLTPVKSPIPGVEVFDVQADSIGKPMSGYLARPVGAPPRSLPAMILTHGAGVASSRLSVAAGWAKEGFLALDFNAHGLPNAQTPEHYANLYKTELEKYYLKNPESRETIFFLSLFTRLMRAIDVLTVQPEWDGKILVANGRSQGGGQSIAAAGLDPRVTFFAAQIPALCDHTGVMAGRINGWPKLVPMTDGKPDEKSLQAARYFDGVNFAAQSKAGAFFTVGFIDVKCPPSSVYAAYNAVSGKKDIVNYFHSGHVGTLEADAAVKSAILSYLKTAKSGTN